MPAPQRDVQHRQLRRALDFASCDGLAVGVGQSRVARRQLFALADHLRVAAGGGQQRGLGTCFQAASRSAGKKESRGRETRPAAPELGSAQCESTTGSRTPPALLCRGGGSRDRPDPAALVICDASSRVGRQTTQRPAKQKTTSTTLLGRRVYGEMPSTEPAASRRGSNDGQHKIPFVHRIGVQMSCLRKLGFTMRPPSRNFWEGVES